MTSTSVDMEYSLSEDRKTFTKVTSRRDNNWTTIVKVTTAGFGRRTEYPMPTMEEFFPKKTLSGQEGEEKLRDMWHFLAEIGRLMETSGGNVVQEMR